jgi:hypothetical protein
MRPCRLRRRRRKLPGTGSEGGVREGGVVGLLGGMARWSWGLLRVGGGDVLGRFELEMLCGDLCLLMIARCCWNKDKDEPPF